AVAVAPFADLSSELRFFYEKHGISGLKRMMIETAAQLEGGFRIDNVSPLMSVGEMDTPVLLAHGRQDDLVPVEESRRLFLAARGPVALVEVNAKHMNIREALGRVFLDRAVEWMDAYISSEAHPQSPPAWIARLPHRNMPP